MIGALYRQKKRTSLHPEGRSFQIPSEKSYFLPGIIDSREFILYNQV
ncbi:hypothetical protein HMPREF9413_3078 [Paenibacillus sp. HGF7]|nr:hypothetical protein HMPREF9413_3078 [Paenibacillus sp. HGF7]